MSVLAFAAYAISLQELFDPRPPTLNISAVRYISCEKWTGSGFLIGDGILATAGHVASGTNCVDVETKAPLKTYFRDEKHDVALMTGKLPTNIPYVKISCARFQNGENYFAYGITNYGQVRPIFRMNLLTAIKKYTDDSFILKGMHGEYVSQPGMRYLFGWVAPGMSGGPIVDATGKARALVNAGSNIMSESYEFADTTLCKPQITSIPSSSVN